MVSDEIIAYYMLFHDSFDNEIFVMLCMYCLAKIIVPSALNVFSKVNYNSSVLLLTWTVSYFNVML